MRIITVTLRLITRMGERLRCRLCDHKFKDGEKAASYARPTRGGGTKYYCIKCDLQLRAA